MLRPSARFVSAGMGMISGCAIAASEFPTPHDSETDSAPPRLSAAEAAARMTVPAGCRATVFAAEPDVQNPIALAWDARGRLWVAENFTYAEHRVRYDLNLRDRILIFEDGDGDGRFDTRKVFADDLQRLTSIEVGLGGVWALALPRVVFIPDRNGDDEPDGPAETVIDGFHPPVQNHHNVASGLRFGPDGWLYGRCGATGAADVRVTGSAGDPVPVRGGMWRYHPRRKVFEAITCGNTNPWGHDWNEHGELFYVNTVTGHLWHAVAGARFRRSSTLDPNPRAYELMDQCADHHHFDTAQDLSRSRDGMANTFGGGHSHVGAMIYLGDNWPIEFRGRLLTLNQHGRRANVELLERRSSGYVARHGEDTLIAADPWFRGVEITYGPDGGVYVADWSDVGECHENSGVHRTSGRIFRITRGDATKTAIGDVRSLSASGLVALHTHRNEWFARQARLELARRGDDTQGLEGARRLLDEMFKQHGDTAVKWRALATLFTIGAADDAFLIALLDHPDEHIRAWAIRLLVDAWPLDTLMSARPAVEPAAAAACSLVPEFVRMARDDVSGLVRLALASALQRLPVGERPALAGELVARAEDSGDPNLPLLVWYGLIPVAERDPLALLNVALRCEWPRIRRFIARRLAEDIETNLAPLDELLEKSSSAHDVIAGMSEALLGWRKAPKPRAWDAFATRHAASTDIGLRDRVRELSALFGEGRALDEIRRTAFDAKAGLDARRTALKSLIELRPADLRMICESLVDVRFLNPLAARGLATFNDPDIAERLVKAHGRFHESERDELIATLVSRPALARALLDAVAAGRIPRHEITPFHARQIRGFNDPALTRYLAAVWGEVRETNTDKRDLVARWKQSLTPAALAGADLSAGRAVWNLACAACHVLHGEGGTLGPDLTGSGRDNLDYLLENIADPGAVVAADFRVRVLHLKDGRTFNGLVTARSDHTLTFQTVTDTVTVRHDEISKLDELPVSVMPDGLCDGLSDTQFRDLVAYLMNRSQVPLPRP